MPIIPPTLLVELPTELVGFGKAIQLSGKSYTVIGVMPADFIMPTETPDVWASTKVDPMIALRYE